MHKIVIDPVYHPDGRRHCTERGPLFDAYYGEEFLVRSVQPFFDGARELQKRGLRGPMEMWDRERPFPRMEGLVEKAALLTVTEPRKGTLRIRAYKDDDRFGS